MFCPKCGTNAGDGAFCPSCGNKMPNAGRVEETVTQAVDEVKAAASETVEQVTENVSEQVSETVQQVTESVDTQVNQAVEAVQETVGAVPMTEQIPMAAPIDVAPVVETVQQTAENAAQEVKEEVAAAEQVRKEQPVINASAMGSGNADPNFAMGKPAKGKKKWPIVVGIVAVLAAIAAAIFFAWPMIQDLINPNAKAINALKKATAAMETSVDEYVEGGYKQAATPKSQNIKGALKIEKFVAGGTDYTDSILSKYININSDISLEDTAFAGDIGMGKSEGSSELTMEYYMSTSRLFFKFPELSDYSFYLPIESDVDLSELGSMSGTTDLSSLGIQEEVVKAATNAVIDACNTFIEDLEYNKVGKDTYKATTGDIAVTVYEITVKEAHVRELIKNLIKNLFDEKELDSYMSMLTAFGVTEDYIIAEVDKIQMNMPDIKFTMYVNGSNEVVNLIIDMADYGSQGTFSIGFVGKDNATDAVELKIAAEGMEVVIYAGEEDGKQKFEMKMLPDQAKYPGEFLSLSYLGSTQDNVTTVESLKCEGNVHGDTIDVQLTGKLTSSDLVAMSYSSSDFRGAYNVQSSNSFVQKYFWMDVEDNRDVLERVFSKSIVNSLLRDN